jgi:uncharacterized protein
MATADDIIRALKLEPHPLEGGYFRETYRCAQTMTVPQGARSQGTAIYYLLTPATVSAMHRLPGDEVFHFYLGDPVQMLQLADGSGRTLTLGPDVLAGQQLQLVAPAQTWQGSCLVDGGQFALLGATMSPGFDYADYEAGRRDPLISQFPQWTELIHRLTPGG